MKRLNPSKLSVEEILSTINRLVEEGYTQKAIGLQFATPVTGQRVSMYLRLNRISAANRAKIFEAIDRKELGLDTTFNKLEGPLDATRLREAEEYLLYRAQQYRKHGRKIGRGYNPVPEDPDGRR